MQRQSRKINPSASTSISRSLLNANARFLEPRIDKLSEIERNSNKQTVYARIMSVDNQPLGNSQRMYFGYTGARYRTLVGIEVYSGEYITQIVNVAGTGMTAIAMASIRLYGINIIDKHGHRVLENFPLGSLENVMLNGAGFLRGKARRFLIDADMQESYISLNALLPAPPSVNTCIPLTFSFLD